jgi:hypothetical protein
MGDPEKTISKRGENLNSGNTDCVMVIDILEGTRYHKSCYKNRNIIKFCFGASLRKNG